MAATLAGKGVHSSLGNALDKTSRSPRLRFKVEVDHARETSRSRRAAARSIRREQDLSRHARHGNVWLYEK